MTKSVQEWVMPVFHAAILSPLFVIFGANFWVIVVVRILTAFVVSSILLRCKMHFFPRI